jgi:hypothetical protein
MHGKGRAGRAVLDIERERGGLEPQASRLLIGAVLDGKRVCAPRSSGAAKWNSTRPDGSATASATGLDASFQPRPPARLPITVVYPSA